MIMTLSGIDPQQLVSVQQVTRNIRGVIRVNYMARSMTLQLSSNSPESQDVIASLIDQLSKQLAVQLKSFFQIDGEIVITGKK